MLGNVLVNIFLKKIKKTITSLMCEFVMFSFFTLCS